MDLMRLFSLDEPESTVTSIINSDEPFDPSTIGDVGFSVDAIKMETQQAELTVDIPQFGPSAVKRAPLTPRDFEQLPCKFQGPFNFQLHLEDLNSQEPKQSSPWTYSPTLQKLFVQIGVDVLLKFSYSGQMPSGTHVVLRTRFVEPEFRKVNILSCPNHRSGNRSSSNIPSEHLASVSIANTLYGTDTTGHHFARIPFNACTAMEGLVAVPVRLHCFSSCPGSIARRALQILMTLEHSDRILGLDSVEVRVCACPGRDRKAAERRLVVKRKKRGVARTEDAETSDPKPDDTSLHVIKVSGEPQYQMIKQLWEGMIAVGVVSPQQAALAAQASLQLQQQLQQQPQQAWKLRKHTNGQLGQAQPVTAAMAHAAASGTQNLPSTAPTPSAVVMPTTTAAAAVTTAIPPVQPAAVATQPPPAPADANAAAANPLPAANNAKRNRTATTDNDDDHDDLSQLSGDTEPDTNSKATALANEDAEAASVLALEDWSFLKLPPLEATRQWLKVLNLEQYYEIFIATGYDDLDVLAELTAEDLDHMRVTAIGLRRKLLLAAAQLRNALVEAAQASNSHTAVNLKRVLSVRRVVVRPNEPPQPAAKRAKAIKAVPVQAASRAPFPHPDTTQRSVQQMHQMATSIPLQQASTLAVTAATTAIGAQPPSLQGATIGTASLAAATNGSS
eukprot:TRINITY_DN9242_c0_g1_i1.p1 TRINITY_DN9242_c0_g1~~TRINITY_DN9242_c0_g1_i1.p1  ORF type:complete len:695 (+),score=167.17 TRINITY_DN9242_c0_g1_i1:63-2087(+)